ncbi:hypothetical protein OV207_10290 [Corallococcus sp. BB11-1]|uniref:hypothetical protein n=1 Tax=Corallococcus sp. BB11-1 TaxID=2996783 RepID=UPI00226FC6C7|nr:hypothetical protein [Corallococcus sp. BB11-1]MCY1031844.1 hypothetical protein [Corallococcus sp. BB11-1]
MKRMGTKGQRAALMGGLLAVVLGGTGCGSECVDAFDCREKGTPPQGQSWACVEEKCTQVDSNTGGDDAGTDAGTQTDAGTDAGTQTDAGTGTDGGTDGGTGGLCDTVPRDEKLGTLQLQPGFSVAEAAPLSTEVVAVVSTPGPAYSLFALRTTATGRDFFALGTWPDVKLGEAALDTVLAPEDRAAGTSTFPSYTLAYDGTRLLAGYTKSDGSGKVAVLDPVARDATTYVSAPSNFTAAGTTDTFFINGGGLDTVSDGLGVYALVTSTKPFSAVKAVSFPAQVGGSGFSAIADNGIAVFGYSVPQTYVNVAHAVAAAKLATAVSSRTPVVLTDEPEVDVDSNFNNVTGFGAGVAVVRGAFDASFTFVVSDVSRFPLTPGLGGGQPPSVGAREPVLTASDACTSVDLLASLGSDLLVGVTDVNGRRLVRIRQGP